jgi:hypothetical protein
VTTTAERPVLDLSTLAAFDPRPRREVRQQRYLCPLPACADKRPTVDHRSLVVDTETGLWVCHRCGSAGKLREFWTAPQAAPRARQVALRRVYALPARQPTPPPPTLPLQPLDERALNYLATRGITADLAERAGVARYVGRYGRAWLAFPIRCQAGNVVAYQARACDERPHRHHAVGPKALGVFVARPVDPPAARQVVVVDAPLDALAVATAGYVGIACCGTGCAPWLPRVLARRHVLLGQDADEPDRQGRRAGDDAADRLGLVLRSLGGVATRARPVGLRTGAQSWQHRVATRWRAS